jgi:ketosteroid isomerase-like protein
MSPRLIELTAEDVAWVRAYASEVVKTFGKEFEAAADRFPDGQVLLDRFNAAVECVLTKGRGHFRAVDEAHNELCVASALLGNSKLKFIRVEYEPGIGRLRQDD